MNIRKIIASAAAGGVLSLGVGGTAFADSSSPTNAQVPVGATTPAKCAKAPALLDKLENRRHTVEQRLETLRARDEAAKAHHHPRLAKRIETRIDRMQKVRDRISDLEHRIEQRCGLPAPTTNSTGATSVAPAA